MAQLSWFSPLQSPGTQPKVAPEFLVDITILTNSAALFKLWMSFVGRYHEYLSVGKSSFFSCRTILSRTMSRFCAHSFTIEFRRTFSAGAKREEWKPAEFCVLDAPKFLETLG